MREQASHAALSRTCKRLHLVGTEMLFKNGPCLDTTTQVKRFRSACLSKVTPFSIAKGGQKDVPQIREVSCSTFVPVDFCPCFSENVCGSPAAPSATFDHRFRQKH